MHKLLTRQIARAFGAGAAFSPEMARFIETVEATYAQFDDDREMLERSLELSSNELIQRNAELRAIFQAIPDAFVWIDENGRIEGFKPGLDVEGLIGADILSRPMFEALGAFGSSELAKAVDSVRHRGSPERTELFLRTPGGKRFFEARLVSLDKARVLLIIRDITGPKKAEASLREAKLQYETIFNNTMEGLYVSSIDGLLLRANPSLARCLGYDGLGEIVSRLNLNDVYAARGGRKEFFNRLKKHGRVVGCESRLKRRDGAIIWVSENARIVADSSGNPAFIEGSLIDVTERKAAEKTREKASEELEKRVNERTNELIAANESLKKEISKRKKLQQRYREAMLAAEAANKSKTEFLNIVSHELRTPLTSVLGFAKIIRKKLTSFVLPALPDQGRIAREMRTVSENLEIIISEGDRLTFLINDLLDIAKLESGKVELNISPVSLAEVIQRSADATASLFREKGLELRLLLDELPPVPADRDKLVQVVINLFSNAVKFTEKGRVTCRASLKDGRVVVEVEDTGMGIALEKQESVFEKFIQTGTEPLTDKPRGTGLGLAICRKILDIHDGRISVRSQPGKGSVFTFELPAA